MKKVILIFFAIVFATGAFAQTAEKTIECLNSMFTRYSCSEYKTQNSQKASN